MYTVNRAQVAPLTLSPYTRSAQSVTAVQAPPLFSDSVRITARDSVRITAADSVRITASDSVRITASDSVRITARDSVRITARREDFAPAA